MRIHAIVARLLTALGMGALLAGPATVVGIPSPAGAACTIQGPVTVAVDESFTLCGPQGVNYAYEWHGRGIAAATRSRCVTLTVRAAGTYEYELLVADGVRRERCVHLVRVGGGQLGTLTCAITGPTSIQAGGTARLCAPQSSRHSYTWSGPAGFSATTACVDVREEGIYDVTIRNALTGYERECTHRLEVIGGSQDVDCAITGPTTIRSGSSVQLCGPSGSSSYRWTGPNGFASTSRCVVVETAGDYSLTVRNASGNTGRCDHRVDWTGSQPQSCAISGPTEIPLNGTARLCGPTLTNSTYQWIGPGGFQSTMRCINADSPGSYELSIRNTSTGAIRECSATLTGEDDTGPGQDPDAPISDNCPRALLFWRQSVSGGSELSRQELSSIARRVDERSSYFNWTNDLQGLTQALQPTAPLTNRKNLARHFAALLANLSAAELGVTTSSGEQIGLDPDTEIRFGSARTIGQIVSKVDQLLMAKTGNYKQTAQRLDAINRGRGLGPVCE